jgi:hypothetical protein
MEEQAPIRAGKARPILAALVAVFGVAMFAWTVRSGRGDSALVFVALPTALAVALVLLPGRTTHGRVFQLTTVALLLTAVALHEGAICVVLAAPLVYAVAHGVTAVARLVSTSHRHYALALLPLLLVTSLEGVDDDLRVYPEQTVTVSRVVDLAPAEVARRLARGPQPAPVRSIPLRLLGVPLPQVVAGDGLDVGKQWMFHYPGSSHGSGGHTITKVVAASPGHVEFAVLVDSAITTRWMQWRGATLRWRPVGANRTQVVITLSYERRLDPSWYFGPVQHVLTREGAGHLLDAMAVR